jgi:hypothetical protein
MLQVCCILASLASPIKIFNNQNRYCHAEPFASLRVNSAKHLCVHRERPFAALRVTKPCRFWSGNFIIGGYVLDKLVLSVSEVSALYSLNPAPEAALAAICFKYVSF